MKPVVHTPVHSVSRVQILFRTVDIFMDFVELKICENMSSGHIYTVLK